MMLIRFILIFIGTYLLIGLVRNIRTWKGHRAEIVGYIAHNSANASDYFRPWLEWLVYAALWPMWMSQYPKWRTSTKLIKAGERDKDRVG